MINDDLNKIVKAKLFCAIMCAKDMDTEKVIKALTNEFGKIESASGLFDFDYTDYYNVEFGNNLQKMLIVFEQIVKQDSLAEIKNKTNSIEQSYRSKDGSRKFNIDPGLILPSRLILASTKDFSHRIYIGKGIYAEVTLMFSKKGVKHLEWTYPDYKDVNISDFLLKIRKDYIKRLRES